jgi:hypothetical protein
VILEKEKNMDKNCNNLNGIGWLFLLFLIAMVVSSPRHYEIKGIVEKVEVIFIKKSFFGETHYVAVSFQGKEPVLLHRIWRRRNTKIIEGKAYKITYTKDGAIKEVELIE